MMWSTRGASTNILAAVQYNGNLAVKTLAGVLSYLDSVDLQNSQKFLLSVSTYFGVSCFSKQVCNAKLNANKTIFRETTNLEIYRIKF